MKQKVTIYELGRADYRNVWELQHSAQKSLIQQKKKTRQGEELSTVIDDMLFFVEHPHVYTLGKSGDKANLLKSIADLNDIDAEFIEIDRGGDITYHGPGQIVGYPILDLDKHVTDLHKYLRKLEEIIIKTCADFDVKTGRIEGLTGVWAGDEKICAMGLRCSRWVTMHGFALNVNTDLSYFNHIVPCGIQNKSVTSLQKCLGTKIDPEKVKQRIINHFCDLFDLDPVKILVENERDLQISYL